MNLRTHFPERLHWTADPLVDAVPPRLHQLFAFDAMTGADLQPDSANASRMASTRHTRSDLQAYTPDRPSHAVFRLC